MVSNEELIRLLAKDLTPVAPQQTRNDLLLGLSCGAAVALGGVLLVSGVQPNLLSVAHGGPLVFKLGYTLSLAAIAGTMLIPISRPGSLVPNRKLLVGLLAFLLAGIALAQTVMAAEADIPSLWLGSSWQRCPLRIVLLALPVFAGVCWAIRRQAPLQLRVAGAFAGLVAGGIGASLYALACTENGAGFILVWYTLGIALSTGLGAVVGPRVLRW